MYAAGTGSSWNRCLRRIPLSRRSHIIGFQAVHAGVVEHESALERDFLTLTSFVDANCSITSQPVTIRFHHEGESRRYTPHYLVRWSSCATELIEVKYQKDLDVSANRLRPAFGAAHLWARQNGASFRIVTEQQIWGPLLENAKRLLPLRRVAVDPKAAVRVLTLVAGLGTPTFGHIVEALPEEGAVILATLWRLIARGELQTDLSAPISLDSMVCLP